MWPFILTLSNLFHNTSSELKFGHNIGKVEKLELYQIEFTTPFHLSSHHWVALKNLTIHTITQSLALFNFFHKTSREFKFGHNIGRVELYKKKTIHNPFCFSHPWVALKIWPFILTLSNLFHNTSGELKFGHNT